MEKDSFGNDFNQTDEVQKWLKLFTPKNVPIFEKESKLKISTNSLLFMKNGESKVIIIDYNERYMTYFYKSKSSTQRIINIYDFFINRKK